MNVGVPWSSKYLARGFAQDLITLHEVKYSDASLSARFSVETGPDGPIPFHLSTISAHRVVAQCGIDFICRVLRTTKEELGEVWELNHAAHYRRKVLTATDLSLTMQLVSRGYTRELSTWLFQFDVDNGAFYGELELAPGLRDLPRRGTLESASDVHSYVSHYLSFYGDSAKAARTDPGVYKPKSCTAFRPDADLVEEIRTLAGEMGACIEKVYQAYFNGDGPGAHGSVSKRLAAHLRPALPTMIRLDVIEAPEGCKVVEINAGNCGGIETYYRMYSFLRSAMFPSAAVVPPLLQRLLSIMRGGRGRSIVLAYLDDGQSKFLTLARKGILQSIAPDLDVEVCHFGDMVSHRSAELSSRFLYRDFVYEELDPATDIGKAGESLLLSLEPHQYFPSLGDEFLSDKAYIAEIDRLVRVRAASSIGFSSTDEAAWRRWMTPTTTVDRVLAHRPSIDFATPNGIVLKPADGYGGDGVTVLPVCALPTNRSFYRGRPWILQPFLPSATYNLERDGRSRSVHLVHGVFLLPDQGGLRYAGTFTRLSPDLVVNVGNDGEVVLFCEPEWK